MKIGVITLPFSPNYGWLLQAYALQQTLIKNGHDAILISRRWNIIEKNNSLFMKIMRPFYYNVNCGRIYRFYKKHIKTTKVYRDSDALRTVIQEYKLDAVIVGSDQVWRIEDTRGVGYNFFLDFADDNVLKMSYAASYGTDEWKGTENDNKIIKNLLNSFSGISVREESGIDICSKYFNKKAVNVLDPTLLLHSEDYDKVLNRPNLYVDKNILATYILDPTPQKDNFVNRIANAKNLSVDPLYVTTRSRFHIYKSVENWLLKIRNSKFVIVDSFHGMVFCIIFKKQFLAIANKNRGYTRFISLLKLLGIENRLVYNMDDVDYKVSESVINYDKVDSFLEIHRQESLQYLLNTLNKSKL